MGRKSRNYYRCQAPLIFTQFNWSVIYFNLSYLFFSFLLTFRDWCEEMGIECHVRVVDEVTRGTYVRTWSNRTVWSACVIFILYVTRMMTTHTTWTLLYVINIEMDGGEDACVPCTTLPLCYTHYPNNDDSSACVRTVDLEYVQRKRYFHNIFHTTTNRYYYLLIFIKLHHTTLHHTTPHHTALHCTALHYTTQHYTTPH